jgi:porphobilinogen deaminase
MKHEPTLEERIKKLHEEIDAVVAAYVDSRAAQVPGVPRGNVEAIILARAGGCRCEEYRLVQAKLEAERKLADVQVSTG